MQRHRPRRPGLAAPMPGVDSTPGSGRTPSTSAISSSLDVVPFHQLGRDKCRALSIPYTLDSVAPPSPEAVAGACDVFRAAGLTAV